MVTTAPTDTNPGPIQGEVVVDDCLEDGLFRELIGGIMKNSQKPDRDGRSTDSGAAVGNSTAGCQGDGTGPCQEFDDEASSQEDKEVPVAADGDSLGRNRNNDGGEKRSNNEVLGIVGTSSDQLLDRRVYTNYEAAGLPREELRRLVRVLHNSAIAGRRGVSISLRLPELGEVRFNVRIEGKNVFIHAFCESGRAGTALGLAIPDLKERLFECGLVLGKFDLTTGQKSDENHETEQRRKEENKKRESETDQATRVLRDQVETGLLRVVV